MRNFFILFLITSAAGQSRWNPLGGKSRLGNGVNPKKAVDGSRFSTKNSGYKTTKSTIKSTYPKTTTAKKTSNPNSWIQNLFNKPMTNLAVSNSNKPGGKMGKSGNYGRKRGRNGYKGKGWKNKQKQQALGGATSLIEKIRNLMPNKDSNKKPIFRSAADNDQNTGVNFEPQIDLGHGNNNDSFDDHDQENAHQDSDFEPEKSSNLDEDEEITIEDLVTSADFDIDTEFKEWESIPIDDVEFQEIAGFQARSQNANNDKKIAKPRQRSKLTESLNNHFKPILFSQELHGVKDRKRASCLQRKFYSQPVCCVGEDSFCQAPISGCSCDDSCVYFGDCCGDYKAICRFASFHIDHTKDDKQANYFSRGPGQTEILVSRFASDYRGAKAFCKKQANAKLISLHNRDFWNVAMRKLDHYILQKTPNQKLDFWIGLDDQAKEGSFVWTDGTTEYEGYTHWAQNNPERGGPGRKQQKRAHSQDCVHLSGVRDNKWVDSTCNVQKRFICERTVDTKKLEKGVAKITGDPHIITFDNFLIHFENTCSFTLTELCRDKPGNQATSSAANSRSDLSPFFIVGEIDNVANLQDANGNGDATTISSINYYENYADYGYGAGSGNTFRRRFRLKDLHFHFGLSDGEVSKTISLMYNKIPMVNGQQVTLPYQDREGNTIVIDGFYLVLTTSLGIIVYSDGKGHAEIEVPHQYFNNLCGLLGNFDHNSNNDIADSKGVVSSTMTEFANSWRTNENPSCQIRQVVYDMNDRPCPEANLPLVNKFCRNLLIKDEVNNPFSECLAAVNSNHFFEMCAMEICSLNPAEIEDDTEGKLTGHCDFYEAMLLDCRRYEIPPFDWRINGFCTNKMHECPENSHYSSCGDACPKTCYSSKEDILISEACKDRCVEGCFCNVGYVFENSGKCVKDTKKCGCINNETQSFVNHGAVTMNQDCSQQCTCDDGEMVCQEHECDTGLICQEPVKGIHDHEFSTCVSFDEIIQEEDFSCLEENYVIPTLKPATQFKGFHGTRHPGGKIESGLSDNIDGLIDMINNDEAMRQIVEMTDPLWIKPDACCGPKNKGQPYNSETHGCCMGRVYNKEHYKCCDNLRMHIKIESECPEKLLPNINDIPNDLIPEGPNYANYLDNEHASSGNPLSYLYEADGYQNNNNYEANVYAGNFDDSVDNSFFDPDVQKSAGQN